MITYGQEVSQGATLDADVCIIGAGAAGISIAQELIDTPLRVIVLESGLPSPDPKISSLYAGDAGDLMRRIGHPDFLTASRSRREGGSTNCWGGTCRPLDPIDFEQRSGLPFSGWPIAYRNLVPYYKRAQTVLHLNEFVYDDPRYWLSHINSRQQQLCLLPLSERMKTVVFQEISHAELPVDRRKLGLLYEGQLLHAMNLTVYRDANVLYLETNRSSTSVALAHVSTIAGHLFRVRAKHFILAAGGIENTRILMMSDQNQTSDGGLGNHADLLGRFFAVHPLIQRAADTSLDHEKWAFYTQPWIAGSNAAIITGRLAPSDRILRETEMGNFRIYLPFYDAADRVVVNLNWEQIPNPDSRVTLSDETDHLGSRKVQLDWHLSPQDKATACQAIELLSLEFAKAGLGRIDLVTQLDGDAEDWLPSTGLFSPGLDPGDHHIGTTRMASDPNMGVVDANCRVHHISNLYIASSSVFPTGGYANPTLTIIALAIRIADRVRAIEGRPRGLPRTLAARKCSTRPTNCDISGASPHSTRRSPATS
jgi:choline dehydrogenase-like flavoprotein